MKTLKLVLYLLLFSTAGYAQKNIIKTNPIGDVLGVYNIGYERQVTSSNSFAITFYNFNFSKFKGNSVSGEYRFYLDESKPALKGLFVSPSIYYFDVDEKNGQNRTFNEFGILFNLGYQWTLFSNITLDSFLGVGIISTDELASTNLGAIIGLNIGYQW